jgi:hypothetical protein
MKAISVKLELTVKTDYSYAMRRGDKVSVDRFCVKNGVLMLRISSVWRSPKWFCWLWFKEF